MPVPKRILSIHAHPDDAEILAGGTLALLAQRGHHLTIVTMTPGDCGSHDYSSGEIARIRRVEAANAASMIGADYICAEFRDLSIFIDDPSRRRVVELLRKTQPDLVLTASPTDYMCDHEATSKLVTDACFAAPAPNYLTGDPNPAPPLAAIPHLYFMNPISGLDRDEVPVIPDFVVDVASTFQLKRDMLARHESQRKWLLQHHGMDDYLMTMEMWTRDTGAGVGIEYGEGFRRYKGHPYPQTPLLEELAGAGVIFYRHSDEYVP
ncbi:MAG: PIG-L family deacetylase [Bryobacteraceae bacterium]|nr:PIG-L family deacetylase [Bryobacterales bacterium]MEB2364016.1 PIG-L family deacetylase [Bryobacterales bacterium]NUN03345.1 PIG-L family deacetylase [Bryobacteraceae bacterium]